MARIQQSPQYNSEQGQFQNPGANELFTGDQSHSSMLYEFFFSGAQRVPKHKLPEAPPSLDTLNSKSQQIRFIWFGHSTLLLEIDGKRILIDPIFSTYASPVPGLVKRFQPPVFDIDEIKNIDIVLISHDHYDHLDYKTISRLKDRDIQFIVPLGVGAHLEYWGIPIRRIMELDWWDSVSYQELTLTATPAQHFSGRGMFNRNSTLWASWAIQGKQQSVFFSGDSGYSKHYRQIGDRLGPFDLTFLENGAYNPAWQYVHQLPEEGVQAHIDLRGRVMVPIHWGMFNLALHSWHDPVERVSKEAKKRNVSLIVPKLGQLVVLNQAYQQEEWWLPLIIQRNKPDRGDVE